MGHIEPEFPCPYSQSSTISAMPRENILDSMHSHADGPTKTYAYAATRTPSYLG